MTVRKASRIRNYNTIIVLGLAFDVMTVPFLSGAQAQSATPVGAAVKSGAKKDARKPLPESQQSEQLLVTGQKLRIAGAKPETQAVTRTTLTRQQIEQYTGGLSTAVSGSLNYVGGVHFAGNDGTGIAEGTFTIRGFSGDQIGFTRDGVPLNDPMFLTPHVDFMGDPENYEDVQVIYGSPSINAPTLTASGGQVKIDTLNPSDKPSFFYKQTFGNNDLFREFGRVNFGKHGGFSGWVSASHTSGSLWTNNGGSEAATRYEANLRYQWGEENEIKLVASSYDMQTNAFSYPTLAQYQTQPYGTNFGSRVLTTGHGTYGVADVSSTTAPAQALNRADFRIQTFGLNTHFKLHDRVRLNFTPYFVHVASGMATFGAMTLPEGLVNSDLNGDGDRLDTTSVGFGVLPTQNRGGFTTTVDAKLANWDTVQVGFWYDHTGASNQMPFLRINDNGSPQATDGSHLLTDASGRKLYLTNQDDVIETEKVWIQNDLRPIQSLDIVSALAWQHTQNSGHNNAGFFTGEEYDRSQGYYHLLPSGSISYRLNGHNQFYYNDTLNIRPPAIASIYGNGTPKAETTWNQELGWRYTSRQVFVDASVFLAKFKNRQVSYAVNSAETAYFNAGNVTSRGAQVSVHGKLPYNFNYFASWAFVDARQASNYTYNGIVAPTRDKQLFNTPQHTLVAGLGYDDGKFYSNFLIHYTSSFYGDLANTQKIPGYETFDLNFGYHFHVPVRHLGAGTVSLNLNNIANRHYLGGVYSGTVDAAPGNSFSASPTYIRGAPRTVFANISMEIE